MWIIIFHVPGLCHEKPKVWPMSRCTSQGVVSTLAHCVACSWQLLTVAACWYPRDGVERRPIGRLKAVILSNQIRSIARALTSSPFKPARKKAYHDCTESLEGFYQEQRKARIPRLKGNEPCAGDSDYSYSPSRRARESDSNLASRRVRVIHTLSTPALLGKG